jgi:flagellar basal-body rod modification protein FlgD
MVQRTNPMNAMVSATNSGSRELPKSGEKFGDVWNKIQSQYGARPEKPREIKKTLGKDDFLKLMVLQMKNQDPTKPFDPDQMGSQLAQFASVEQLQNMNKSIEKLTSSGTPSEKMAMTNMIGKWVTLDKARFEHIEGQNSLITYTLPKDADSVSLQLVSDAGEVVFSKELGSQKAGEQSFNWDGVRTNTLPAKTGVYYARLVAKDASGVSIPIHTVSEAPVIGVSYEGKEPVLLVGDAKAPMKVTLNLVSKIAIEPQTKEGGKTVSE